jgi:segregation and condensation protein B
MVKKKNAKAQQNEEVVSMVQNPYGFPTIEVADAQESDTVSLNEPSEDEAQLERISQAITDQQEKDVGEMIETQEVAIDAAAELARQIAEDQELAKQLAKEAEEAAEAEALDPELQAALPQLSEDGEMDLREVQSCIEALLFMTDKPMSMNKLRENLSLTEDSVFPLPALQEALTLLKDRYRNPEFGIELMEISGGYQFRTKPIRAPLARKLAKVQTQRLSSGAMETLAIVAYRQPVMKDDIDQIRGVDSSYFIRGLLDRRLIKISGRSELPGRPMLYSTSDEFLEIFGLKDLSSMPSLREIEQMIPTSQSGNPEDEDPRVKQMRKLVSEMNSDHSGAIDYDPREDEKILKEIRERVSAIPTSTPTLDAQKEAEKQAKLAAEQAVELAVGQQAEMALNPESETPAIEIPAIEIPPVEASPEANPESIG